MMGASDFPQQVRDMLKSALPDCLTVPKEERHRFQEELIKMAGQVLESLMSSAQSKVDTAEKALSDLKGEEAARQAVLTEASNAMASKKKAVEDAEAAVKESISAVKAGKEDLASAEREQKAGDVEIEAAAKKRDNLESVMANLFMPLKDGTVVPDQAKAKTA